MGAFGRFLRLDSRFRRAGLMALDCFMVVEVERDRSEGWICREGSRRRGRWEALKERVFTILWDERNHSLLGEGDIGVEVAIEGFPKVRDVPWY